MFNEGISQVRDSKLSEEMNNNKMKTTTKEMNNNKMKPVD